MEPTQGITEVTDATFAQEVLAAELPVMVCFTATWCGPCKAMTPTVAKIAAEFAGRLKVCSVDVDKGVDLTARYSVKSVPTVLAFKRGEGASPHVGMMNYQALKRYATGLVED